MGERWACELLNGCARCADLTPIEAEMVAQARSQNDRAHVIADETFVVKLYAEIRRLSK